MKRISILLLTTLLIPFVTIDAQKLTMLKAVKLKKWNVPSANYSGITYLGNDHYAVVSDKEENDGWYEFLIRLNRTSGRVEDIRCLAFHATDEKGRDAEGVCFVPDTKTLFVAGEADQYILEYNMGGQWTGRELDVPRALDSNHIVKNYGFEALTYSAETELFWTCTENVLHQDGAPVSDKSSGPAHIRLQSFTKDMRPARQYLYLTDTPHAKHRSHRQAFGVPALTALSDGSLLVLEREFHVASKYIGSYVINKVYRVHPEKGHPLPSTQNIRDLNSYYALPKMLLAEWKTKLNLKKKNLANYEGMCLGPKLKDGRQTLLFISDSQGGYGNVLFRLKDYLRVGILDI